MEEEVGFSFLPSASLLQGGEDSRAFENLVDASGGSRDDEVASLRADEVDEFPQAHHAGGIEVVGILHAQNDDPDVGVNNHVPDLGLEKFGCSKKEGTFDMDDGDCGIGSLLFSVELENFTAIRNAILDEFGPGDFSQKQKDRKGGSDEDGSIEREDQGGDESGDEHPAVFRC